MTGALAEAHREKIGTGRRESLELRAAGVWFIVDNLLIAYSGVNEDCPATSAKNMPSPPDIRPATARQNESAIELLQQHSLTTLVLRELERQIVSGEVGAGTKLSEADIASQLRVSRGPVREAFRALEQSGLVRTEKNRGVFVRQLSLGEANEIYEVRAALDALIGRLAAQRIRPEQMAQLRDLVKRMQAAGRARDADAYFPLNIEFHETLAQAAGNVALLTHYRRVVNELSLFRRETLKRNVANIPISTRDHEAIVNAVDKGDAALAEQLLYKHVIDSRERLHKALQAPAAAPTRSPRAA
jgi:phosphonate utilization transcriptional regulator